MAVIERKEDLNFFNGHEDCSIIHLSDIHLWYSTKILNRIKETLSLNNPDLIILTGDYYDLPIGAYNFRSFLKDISLKIQSSSLKEIMTQSTAQKFLIYY